MMMRFGPWIAVVALMLAWSPAARSDDKDKDKGKPPAEEAGGRPPIDDPVMPINEPDRYAWELFTYVNARAPKQGKVKVGGREEGTHDALWETWASDTFTFPDPPDPAKPPKWEDRDQSGTLRKLRPRSKVEAIRSRFHLPHVDLVQNGGGEEVVRNRPSFEHIIKHKLWYTQGLAEAFKAGRPIKFPKEALEIKANWTPITADQKHRYHWNYDADGKLYGMIAMHISSKVLPNWFWATFEWVDNPGRSDYIGCRDAFGADYGGKDPSFQPPNPKTLHTVYPPGKVTPRLVTLFERGEFARDWSAEYQNYRLKGSQVDFTDSTGLPTMLGNSVTEEGFVQTSSCITCHARAAATAAGADAFPEAGFKPLLPGDTGVQSFNGPVDPSWYWSLATDPPPTPVALQMDFVWAIPFRAKAAKSPGK